MERYGAVKQYMVGLNEVEKSELIEHIAYETAGFLPSDLVWLLRAAAIDGHLLSIRLFDLARVKYEPS